MENIDKLKNKLEHRFKAVFGIPKNQIAFPFFVAIHDYVDFIEKDEYLRGLLYGHNDFKPCNPKNLLVKRGREIADINNVFKDKKTPNLLIAFFNLYGVYIGINDLDKSPTKTDTHENRLKIVKQLENIRNGVRFANKGYFWAHRSKYYGWVRIVNNELLFLMEANRQAQKIKKIKEAKKAEKTKETKQPKITTKPAEIKTTTETNPNISYNHDLPNQLVWFTFNGKEIGFKGNRSIVFHFFYMLGKINNSDYQTYKNFNDYLIANGFKKISSVSFRQSIDNINKRVKDDIKDLKSLIKLKEKNNPKEVNRYQWKMEI
jgi:hypothetical protein